MTGAGSAEQGESEARKGMAAMTANRVQRSRARPVAIMEFHANGAIAAALCDKFCGPLPQMLPSRKLGSIMIAGN